MAALGLVAAVSLPAQGSRYRPPDNQPADGRADQAEGARIMRDFRRAGIAGDYWLQFDLRILPNRGAERTIRGQLFGTRVDSGPLSRLVLGERQDWIIRSGRDPAAWQRQGGAFAPVPDADLLTRLAGTNLTLFDLQMPFLYWNDYVYEGTARVRGRQTQSFILYPPESLATRLPGLAGVRIHIDAQFQALFQAEMLGATGAVERTITILDLKKADEQWIVKSIDVRDLRTRDKTRFLVTAAALNLELPADTFTAAGGSSGLPAVPRQKIQRF